MRSAGPQRAPPPAARPARLGLAEGALLAPAQPQDRPVAALEPARQPEAAQAVGAPHRGLLRGQEPGQKHAAARRHRRRLPVCLRAGAPRLLPATSPGRRALCRPVPGGKLLSHKGHDHSSTLWTRELLPERYRDAASVPSRHVWRFDWASKCSRLYGLSRRAQLRDWRKHTHAVRSGQLC